MSVGNLPPKAKVLIKITYVCQLRFDGASVVFELPTSVAPWTKDTALSHEIQVRYSHNMVTILLLQLCLF